jgi:hypothetical protein
MPGFENRVTSLPFEKGGRRRREIRQSRRTMYALFDQREGQQQMDSDVRIR